MKDLKSFISEQMGIEGIHEKSLLMDSRNTSLEVETVNLTSFTNNFHEKFAEYFEYDGTTGELTCKKDGEYLVTMDLDCCGYRTAWAIGQLDYRVNNIYIGSVYGVIEGNSTSSRDCNTIRIFLKKGDKLSFSKRTYNAKPALRNNATIYLIKM